VLLTRVCFGVRRYLGILLYDPIVSAAPVLCNGLFNPQAGNATDGERWKGRRGKKYRRKALFIGNVRKGRGGAGEQECAHTREDKHARATHIFTYVLAPASAHTVFPRASTRTGVMWGHRDPYWPIYGHSLDEF